jgi:hypothetical protein
MKSEEPKWREAWCTDSPEWVKYRKDMWGEVKSSPVLKNKFNKDDLILLSR